MAGFNSSLTRHSVVTPPQASPLYIRIRGVSNRQMNVILTFLAIRNTLAFNGL